LAVLWQAIARGVLIAWFALNYRTGMLRVRRRIWKIRGGANRVDKTVPAALKAVRVRMNFTALFPRQDHTIKRIPAFLRLPLMNMDNSVFPASSFHNFTCQIQAGKPRSIYSTNPYSVESSYFNFLRLSSLLSRLLVTFYPV
jgi:hypothetical protein